MFNGVGAEPGSGSAAPPPPRSMEVPLWVCASAAVLCVWTVLLFQQRPAEISSLFLEGGAGEKIFNEVTAQNDSQ